MKIMNVSVRLLLGGLCWLAASHRDVLGQKPELIVHSGHSSSVDNVWLSPDGGMLISQSADKLIFWNLNNKRSLREVPNVKKFFVSPDSKTVVTLNKDYNQLDLWGAGTASHLSTVVNLVDWSFSQDGRLLLSVHGDSTLQVRDLGRNEGRTIKLLGRSSLINCLPGPDGNFALVSTQENNGSIYAVDLTSSYVSALSQDTGRWAVSPDGRFLVIRDRKLVIRGFELITLGNGLSQRETFTSEGLNDWELSRTGKYLLADAEDKAIRIIDIETGQLKLTYRRQVYFPEFGADDEILYQKGSDLITIYDMKRGKWLSPVPITDEARIDFAPDGKRLFIYSRAPRPLILWDVTGGRQVLSVNQKSDHELISLRFSFEHNVLVVVKAKPVGKGSSIYEGSSIYSVSAFNLLTGEEKQIYEYSKPYRYFYFKSLDTFISVISPVTIDATEAANLPVELEADNKDSIEESFAFNRGGKGNIALKHKGNLLVVGDEDGNISICDIVKAQRTHVLRSHITAARAVFSEGEKGVNIYQEENSFRSWEFGSGKISGPVESKPPDRPTEKFTQEVTGKEKNSTYTLKRTGSGKVALQVKGVNNCHLSPDLRKVLCTKSTISEYVYDLEVWSVAKRKVIFRQTGVGDKAGFSPDGRKLYLTRTVELEDRVEVWDFVSNELKLRAPNSGNYYWNAPLSFSPDSTKISFGNEIASEPIKNNTSITKYSLHIWSIAEQKKILSAENIYHHNFNADWSVLIAVSRKQLTGWDFKTGSKKEREFTAANNIIDVLGWPISLPNSKSNNWLFTGTQTHGSGIAIIWNSKNNQLYTLGEHSSLINSAEFSRDERYLLTSSNDGTVRLWNTDNGRLIITLVLLNESDWLVMTPEGFFDGTPYAWKQLLWRFNRNNTEDVPVELYFNDFFRPNLLQEVLAGNPPEPVEGRKLEEIDRRQPKVEIVAVNGKTKSQIAALAPGRSVASERMATIEIEVTDSTDPRRQPSHQMTSGAHDLRLFRNGSLVRLWRGDLFSPGEKEGCRLVGAAQEREPRRVLCQASVPVVAGNNNFTAYAFNSSKVKSNDDAWVVEGAESLRRAGTLYVLAIGINIYSDADYNLRYARADAVRFGAEVEREQRRMQSLGKSSFDDVRVVTLLDGDARKENVLLALERLSGAAGLPPPESPPEIRRLEQAEPEDAVIIYFAGHGMTQGGNFYFITHDLGRAARHKTRAEEGWEPMPARGISDQELETALEKVNASYLLMVIDACNSGQALGADRDGRGPANSIGLAQLAYDKGMYILAAAQSYQAAWETTRLKHGLLTYALVVDSLGPRADESPADGEVTAKEWLSYAAERVPQLQVRAMLRARKVRKNRRPDVRPEEERAQRPRVFYRREQEERPLVITSVRPRAARPLPSVTQ